MMYASPHYLDLNYTCSYTVALDYELLSAPFPLLGVAEEGSSCLTRVKLHDGTEPQCLIQWTISQSCRINFMLILGTLNLFFDLSEQDEPI